MQQAEELCNVLEIDVTDGNIKIHLYQSAFIAATFMMVLHMSTDI